MYKLRINVSKKSDYEATYYDSATWWKNFNDWYHNTCTVGMNKDDYMLQVCGCSYEMSPEWILKFNTEEDATVFKLRFS